LAADEIRDLLAGWSGRVVVGVTGPLGVGKSTCARRLVDEPNGVLIAVREAGCDRTLRIDEETLL
jgi:putative protein kinase ArgK-like GTPase of G3E family